MTDRTNLMTTILEHLPLGVFVVAPGGVIRYANPAMARVSGLAVDEMLGTNILEVESYRRDGVADRIAGVFAGTPFRLERYAHTSLAGRHSVRNAWGLPLDEGPDSPALVFVEDITAEVEARARELDLQARLAQAQKMESIGRLAGGVAHDFNNLLSVILGYGELATSRLPEGDPAGKLVAKMVEAGEHAAGLTRQLLAFSRRQVLELEVFDLNAVVGDVLTMLQRVLGEDIVIRFGTRGEALFVEADRGQVEQVVMNLAVNARDAMPGGGTLTLETRRGLPGGAAHGWEDGPPPHGCAVLTVTDTGEGMDEATRERIFEPFFTTKEASRGTGLGLATVYGIVRQHGGTIQVASRPGEGATFTVQLPLTDRPADRIGEGTRPGLAGGTETLLVVEDEDAIRDLLVESLENLGYRVLSAPTGEAALEAAEGERPALLLTDVVMPAINGRELADRLEARHPGMAVLFMPGYTDGAIAHHGVLDPGTTLLQKPVTPAAVARRIREALDAR